MVREWLSSQPKRYPSSSSAQLSTGNSPKGDISYNVTEYPELYNFYTCILNGENFTGEELTQIRRDMAFRINGEDSMKEWEHTGRYYRSLSEETL